MTITTVLGYDAIHTNVAKLPKGQAAGYMTGSGSVPWTTTDWANHPGAIRIDQSPVLTALDETADVLDVERGAATLATVGPWVKAASLNFTKGIRPGQRTPAIYCSRSMVTQIANILIAAGISGGVGLWIADWNNNQAQATSEVANASGPFPIIGRQFLNAGLYDISVFSVPWLNKVSKAPGVKPSLPPGQWNNAAAWTWAEVVEFGIGLDKKLHAFAFDGKGWTKVLLCTM